MSDTVPRTADARIDAAVAAAKRHSDWFTELERRQRLVVEAASMWRFAQLDDDGPPMPELVERYAGALRLRLDELTEHIHDTPDR